MFIQTAFNFSSVVQRLVCRFSGLRLLALRWFVVFLASGPCAASASSYFFRSAAPPRWCCAFSQLVPVAKFKLPVLASGSNISVKPTRILRSAYLAVSLRKTRFIQPHVLFTGVYLFKRLSAGFFVVCRGSPWGAVPVQAFLAASPCAACATSYHFSSSVSPWWCSAFSRLRPSSIQQFLFWLLGLTLQSSRPAFGGRLTFVR